MRLILLACAVVCAFSTSPAVGELSKDPKAANVAEQKRLVTVEDIVGVTQVSSIAVSPDGRSYAAFLYRADASSNSYKTGLYIGDLAGSRLRRVADGAQLGLHVGFLGMVTGDIPAQPLAWSPDGMSIIYSLVRNGETQLWISRPAIAGQVKLTDMPGDVQRFSWSTSGQRIIFSTGRARAEIAQEQLAKERQGFNYKTDLWGFTDLMLSVLPGTGDSEQKIWSMAADGSDLRQGSQVDRLALDKASEEASLGTTPVERATDWSKHAVVNSSGQQLFFERTLPFGRMSKVMAAAGPRAKAISCNDVRCIGWIKKIWWQNDGREAIIWRWDGLNDLVGDGVYAWRPDTGKLRQVYRTETDNLPMCEPGPADKLLCVRESPTRPQHFILIDLRTGSVTPLADPNARFDQIRLGKVERFEWNIPELPSTRRGGKLEGLYPAKTHGYILYPPDYQPGKRYPVFIEPYVARGFNSASGNEHALQAYAASGIVVINMNFPTLTDKAERLGAGMMKTIYSFDLDFPHLALLMESTRAGLKAAEDRGFVDRARVGVGGVSQGTFGPLYWLQNYDELAAISISSPHWGPHEYYWGTPKIRRHSLTAYGDKGNEEWRPSPVGSGGAFWNKIDVADHVDDIETPILMNLADSETLALIKLLRNLDDAGRPYDAYIFKDETHFKWQPAHIATIMQRNLDWFQYWLQDYKRADASVAGQYRDWDQLRAQQCRNPRAVRKC
jgi:dipeptidyl aminopeptidase/acylaminoacyl peptidase